MKSTMLAVVYAVGLFWLMCHCMRGAMEIAGPQYRAWKQEQFNKEHEAKQRQWDLDHPKPMVVKVILLKSEAE